MECRKKVVELQEEVAWTRLGKLGPIAMRAITRPKY